MSRESFIEELKALGFEVVEPIAGIAVIPFLIKTNRFAGQSVRIGFEGIEGYPMHPPKTIHVSPRLHPLRPESGPHPLCGIHASPLGEDWQYWSRPIQGWKPGRSNVQHLIAHVHALFEDQ